MDSPCAGGALSEVLARLAAAGGERVSIGDLLDALGDRALGALLFVFAFPNVLPAVPGTSAILGLPLVFLSAQLALKQRAWLPAFIARRSMPGPVFQFLVLRMGPWLRRAERMLRPRACMLARPPMEYLVGLVCLLLAIVVMLPVPMGNMLPALAICLLALGILERDGLWIVAGLATAVAAAALVSGVVIVFVKTALYLVAGYLR